MLFITRKHNKNKKVDINNDTIMSGIEIFEVCGISMSYSAVNNTLQKVSKC